jgi:hypothetical protein
MIRRYLALAAAVLALGSGPVLAQTNQLPSYQGSTGRVTATPAGVPITNSSTGAPCLAGTSAACPLTTTSSGSTPTGTQNVNVLPSTAGAAAQALAPSASTTAEACRVLKNGTGNLYGVSGYAGQAQFIMVFNSPTIPADGAVTPATWAYVPQAGSWSIDYDVIPARMSTGITVCASTTGPLTKTAIATNNVFSGRVQ